MQDSIMSDGTDAIAQFPDPMQPPPRSRKKKAPTRRESDSEPYKDEITESYTSDTPLREIQEIIETEHGFHTEYAHSRLPGADVMFLADPGRSKDPPVSTAAHSVETG